VVREYKKADKVVDTKVELADLEVLVAEKQASLERWCKTHFGEAFKRLQSLFFMLRENEDVF
jgi:hypothetical protein